MTAYPLVFRWFLPILHARGLWRHPDATAAAPVRHPFVGVPDPVSAS